MRDPRGELFRVYWGFTASREAAHKFSTLTEPFQWEQSRWARALAALGTGQAPGCWVVQTRVLPEWTEALHG